MCPREIWLLLQRYCTGSGGVVRDRFHVRDEVATNDEEAAEYLCECVHLRLGIEARGWQWGEPLEPYFVSGKT